jgi:hypothetical protein
MEATLRTRRNRNMGRCRSGTLGMENIGADYREKRKGERSTWYLVPGAWCLVVTCHYIANTF